VVEEAAQRAFSLKEPLEPAVRHGLQRADEVQETQFPPLFLPPRGPQGRTEGISEEAEEQTAREITHRGLGFFGRASRQR